MAPCLGTSRRDRAVASIAVAAVLSGCTSATELDPTDRAEGGLPAWIRDGRSLAATRARDAAPPTTARARDRSSLPAVDPATAGAGDLTGLLASSGLNGQQSTCLAASLGSTPALAGPATELVSAVASGRTPSDLDATTVAALLAALGPCLAGTSLDLAATAAAGQLAGAPVAASAPTPGAPVALSGIPAGLDLAGLQQAVAQFQQALAGAQNEIGRNLLLALLAALTQGAGAPAATPAPGATTTLPIDVPGGLNLLRLVDRGAFVDNAVRNGASRKLAGCIYDRLAALTNAEIASLPPNGQNGALVEDIVRSIFACATT